MGTSIRTLEIDLAISAVLTQKVNIVYIFLLSYTLELWITKFSRSQ